MVVQRRHQEDALAFAGKLPRDLEPAYLKHNRHNLENEQSANHGERKLVLNGDRDDAEQAA